MDSGNNEITNHRLRLKLSTIRMSNVIAWREPSGPHRQVQSRAEAQKPWTGYQRRMTEPSAAIGIRLQARWRVGPMAVSATGGCRKRRRGRVRTSALDKPMLPNRRHQIGFRVAASGRPGSRSDPSPIRPGRHPSRRRPATLASARDPCPSHPRSGLTDRCGTCSFAGARSAVCGTCRPARKR